MYRCSTGEMLTEKLQNCNGFFATHRYPPFLKFPQRQNFRSISDSDVKHDVAGKTSRVGVYKCLSLIVGFAVTVAIWPREVVSYHDFTLRAVATFRAMSLVGIYPGRASLQTPTRHVLKFRRATWDPPWQGLVIRRKYREFWPKSYLEFKTIVEIQ